MSRPSTKYDGRRRKPPEATPDMWTIDTEQHLITEDLLAALSRLDFPEGKMTVRNRVSFWGDATAASTVPLAG